MILTMLRFDSMGIVHLEQSLNVTVLIVSTRGGVFRPKMSVHDALPYMSHPSF